MKAFPIALLCGASLSLALPACEQSSTSSAQKEVTNESAEKQASPMVANFTIESPAFGPGKRIGGKYAAEGANKPPPLTSKEAPFGTESYALIAIDLDAPRGEKTHWLLWDIPANSEHLDEAVGTKGRNDFGVDGWTGPEPTGSAPHHYVFRLYALDTPRLGLSAGGGRADLERAVKGNIVGMAETTGLYEHP